MLNVLPSNPEEGVGRFPSWLHRKMPKNSELIKTMGILNENRLPTVCEEARCPNLLQCWSEQTATFLVMGKECTRACGFCSIDFSKAPKAPEADEPIRIAESVASLGLKHVVITMVARDDLEDGGALHLVQIMEAIRLRNKETTIELLTSDLSGNEEALATILEGNPEIFNHNIETVRRLTPRVRHKATYDRTLQMLKLAKGRVRFIKSGLMVGLGEEVNEVHETLQDLKNAGVDIVTMGQYLQPENRKLLVKSFVTPDQFEAYRLYGLQIGIPYMYCGPFVRSSYNAKAVFEAMKQIYG
ncbi:MAG: lipoyl synthase [Chlamydiota bacterium]|jgi:lipoyl synthase